VKFESWFRELTGQHPYPYQAVLATSPELPDLLSVPTGAGKTAAVVLGWLWRRRFAAERSRVKTPRRLVFCLPMRSLVEQTIRSAEGWLAAAKLDQSVAVHALLGGAVDERWELTPADDAILVGTQDMLLSRALGRGYAMSRFRWPWHFGLLNSDCLWVMDEVQLMGPGLTTSAQLQGLRERLGTALPTRTLWMSATLGAGKLATVDLRDRPLTRLDLSAEDRANPALARRLAARKPLRASPLSVTKKASGSEARAREVLAAHQPGSLTLVVVNRVRRAQDLCLALRKIAGATPVALLHSRFRPAERRPLQDELLATKPEARWTGILVSTQAIEAGVDISARVLFTELASWSAMVQRFGRCNREGTIDDAAVRWIDIADDLAPPYTEAELALARSNLRGLKDVGPASLAKLPQEPGVPEPPALRRRDLLDLFDTEPDLAGHDIDISRYIRASDEADVQVAWRSWPDDSDVAPPEDSPALAAAELCRVRIHALRDLLKKGREPAYRWSSLERTWERISPDRVNLIIPGMTLLLPLRAGGYDPVLGWTGDPADRPTPIPSDAAANDDDAADLLSYGCADYVTLATHAQDVAEELRILAAAIAGELPWAILERAARWHDLGKVHPVFQDMLTSRLPEGDPRRDGGPWAKSDGQRGGRHQRPGFRHELASALAYLAQHDDDLGAYLIAAHHGKVRMSLRSGPNEQAPPGPPRRFARGVWEGDPLPGAELGEGIHSQPITLCLDLMAFGDHEGSASWQTRTLRLRDEHGVFRLALYEALVRIADILGTKRRTPQEATRA
jgi:CRISPR-associated endonuclease/helicase Cas3